MHSVLVFIILFISVQLFSQQLHVEGAPLQHSVLIENAGFNGILIDSTIRNGVQIDDAGMQGIFLNGTGTDGISITETGQNGITLNNIAKHGMKISSTTEDGINISSTLGDGIEITAGDIGINLHDQVFFGMRMSDPINVGLEILNSGHNSINLANAGVDGLYISAPVDDGLQINNPGDRGIEIFNPENQGIVIDSAGKSGIQITNTFSYGTEIRNSGNHGVFIYESEQDGLYMYGPANHGISIYNTGLEGILMNNITSSGILMTDVGGNGIHMQDVTGSGVAVYTAGHHAALLHNKASSTRSAVRLGHGDDDKVDMSFSGDGIIASDGNFHLLMDEDNDNSNVYYEINRSAAQGGNYAFRVYESGNSYFRNDVNINGNISKGSGTFKIDHPLDPENKFLYHSFVESPDMMNVYNGNIILDENGEGKVELPSYFEALNRDFRYQLTSIGAPGPNLYISKEVESMSFSIAGGTPYSKVSWQITGIRQDPFANENRVEVEVNKSAEDKGKYLHPEAWLHNSKKSNLSPLDQDLREETQLKQPQ